MDDSTIRSDRRGVNHSRTRRRRRAKVRPHLDVEDRRRDGHEGLFCWSAVVPFNDDISAWDTSSVTDMKEMFYGPIGKFNQRTWMVVGRSTRSTLEHDADVQGRKAFDQDLGWCLDNDVGLIDAF